MHDRERVSSKDFGKYQPHQRLNVDSVPFNLDNQAKKSYVHYKTADMVQVSAPDGSNKRFGTLHVCFHGGPAKKKQPRMMMICRGEGGVYESEKFSYHPGVDVVFQKKAWFDKTVAPKWINTTLKRWVDENLDNEQFMLAQDNLSTQKDFCGPLCYFLYPTTYILYHIVHTMLKNCHWLEPLTFLFFHLQCPTYIMYPIYHMSYVRMYILKSYVYPMSYIKYFSYNG